MFQEDTRSPPLDVRGREEGLMLGCNLEWHYRVEWERRQDMRRNAVRWRLLKQAGQPSLLTRRSCWLICQLGRWMERLGQQLQQHGRYEQRPFPL
jgi:hypothetical protein